MGQRAGRSGKARTGRKRGAQPGHPGHQRICLPEEQIDKVGHYYPEARCPTCGEWLVMETEPCRRHQIVDLPQVAAHVHEHRVYAGVCPHCQSRQAGSLPDNVPAGQMGAGLISWITLMQGKFRLSTRLIQSLLQEQWQVSFSVGAISQALRPVSGWLQPLYAQIGRFLRHSTIAHADETPHYRGGELRWLWVLCNPEAVYCMTHFSRGKRAAMALLDGYTGLLVTDRLGSYRVHPAERHQYCWAHLIRNLESMAARKGKAGRLGRRLIRQVRWCIHLHHQWQTGRQTQEDIWRQLRYLRRQIQRDLRRALGWKIPGSKDVYTRTANQCQQLLTDEPLWWTFLHYPELPLTNNEAERAIRPYVIWRKTSFFSQSYRGDQFRPLIISIVETCKRQGINVCQLLRQVCQQGLSGQPVTVRLPLPNNQLLLTHNP